MLMRERLKLCLNRLGSFDVMQMEQVAAFVESEVRLAMQPRELHEQFDEIERLRHENADIKREAEAREEEADKLRLELANTSAGNAVLTEHVSELERENADLRRKLKAAKGEAQRTVYVAHNFADESKMLADLPMPGACYATSEESAKHIDLDKSCAEFPEHVTAVTLTARKVGKP